MKKIKKEEGYLVIKFRTEDIQAFKNDAFVDVLVALMQLAKIEFMESNVYPVDSIVIDENAYL